MRGLAESASYLTHSPLHIDRYGDTILARLKRFERQDFVMTQANSIKQDDGAAVTLSYNPGNEKTPANKRQGFGISGGPGRNRTTDTRIFKSCARPFFYADQQVTPKPEYFAHDLCPNAKKSFILKGAWRSVTP